MSKTCCLLGTPRCRATPGQRSPGRHRGQLRDRPRSAVPTGRPGPGGGSPGAQTPPDHRAGRPRPLPGRGPEAQTGGLRTTRWTRRGCHGSQTASESCPPPHVTGRDRPCSARASRARHRPSRCEGLSQAHRGCHAHALASHANAHADVPRVVPGEAKRHLAHADGRSPTGARRVDARAVFVRTPCMPAVPGTARRFASASARHIAGATRTRLRPTPTPTLTSHASCLVKRSATWHTPRGDRRPERAASMHGRCSSAPRACQLCQAPPAASRRAQPGTSRAPRARACVPRQRPQ